MSGTAVPLPFDEGPQDSTPPEPPPDAPCVYVATKITGTVPGSPERQIIEFAVTAIRDAAVECTQGSDRPWHLRVHAPIEWTTPERTPDMSPADVFQANARHVLCEADGLIVFGWDPSAGVGQEITWAAAIGLPVLYVVPPGHNASRQIQGTAGDIMVIYYASPDDLQDRVRRWLRDHRHRIEAGPSRRSGKQARFDALHQRLSRAWAGIPTGERVRVAAHVGIAPSLIEWWLADVSFLAAAPIADLLMLTLTLTGSSAPALGRQELTLDQLEALLTASDEQGWDRAAAETLRRRGETELALGGVRRFKLDTPEDWVRFNEALQR